jgi:hypothetical protein
VIAVAHPRIPGAHVRPTRKEAQAIFKQAEKITLTYSNRNAIHPLENIDRLNPRPGLRRWGATNNATGESSRWREAWASVHHDGSVTLAAAVGGHRKSSDENFEDRDVEARVVDGQCDASGQMFVGGRGSLGQGPDRDRCHHHYTVNDQ